MANYWDLRFDGAFTLERASRHEGTAGQRVAEEHLETILFRWGQELLGIPDVAFLGRSSQLVGEADLLGADPIGRLHLFELKKDSAGADALQQLIAYLVNRPTSEDDLKSVIVETLFHGSETCALRLAGLVAREKTKTMAHDLGDDARHNERERARLEKTVKLAADRSHLPLSEAQFRQMGQDQLRGQFGEELATALPSPDEALARLTCAKFGKSWSFPKYRGPIAVWVVAPNVGGAHKAAQSLLNPKQGSQRVDTRFVSMDVREVKPGRHWSIAVDRKHPDFDVDQLVGAAGLVMERHCASRGDALADRAFIDFRPAKGHVGIGWRLAGNAQLTFAVENGCVSWTFYDHWWTEGQARTVRKGVLDIKRRLKERHLASWPWKCGADGIPDAALVDAMHALVDDAWCALVETKATDVDRWGAYLPAEPQG